MTVKVYPPDSTDPFAEVLAIGDSWFWNRGKACLTHLLHGVRRRRGGQRATAGPAANSSPLDLFARLRAGRTSWRVYA